MLNVTTISFFIRYHRTERLPQVWQTSNLKIRTFLVAAAMLIVRTHVLRSYDKWLTNLTTWERLYFTKEHTFISSTFFAISKHKIRFLMYKRVLIMCAALTENVIHGITSKMLQSYHFLRIFRTWKGCTYILM